MTHKLGVRSLTCFVQGVFLATLVYFAFSGAFAAPLFVGNAQPAPLFSVTLIAPTLGDVTFRQSASILASNMMAVGIDARVFYVNFDDIVNRMFFVSADQGATFDQGGYDMGFLGWGYTAPIPDFRSNLDGRSVFLAPTGNNYALYNNAELNSVFDRLYSTLDEPTQIDLTHRIQQIVFQDAPYNYIYEAVSVVPRDQKWAAWGSKGVYSEVTFPDVQHWSGGGELTLAESAGVFPGGNLDPGVTTKSNSFFALYIYGAIIGGSLQEVDARNLSFIPGTATNITSTPDGLTWTVHIRPGVMFQDGVELTADDFIFTQYALTNPDLASAALGSNIQYLGNYVTFTFLNGTSRVDDNRLSPDSAKAEGRWRSVDRYTFEFHMPSVYAFTKQTYSAFAPLPMHIMERFPFSSWDSAPFSTAEAPYIYHWTTKQYGGSGSYTAIGPVGAGPYVLESYDFTRNLATLKKFPGYWNATGLEALGQFSVDTYNVVWINSKDAAIAALRNGEVNLLDPFYRFGKDKATLQQMGVSIIEAPELGWQEQGFNLRHPVFGTGVDTPLGRADPSKAAETARNVRKAISHLIPRQQIVDSFAGSGYPLASFLGPGWGVWWDSTLTPDSYNFEAAAQLLRAAGYSVTVGLQASPITYSGRPMLGMGSVTISCIAPVAHMMIIIQQSNDEGITWTDYAAAVSDNASRYSISAPGPPAFGKVMYRANFTGYLLNDIMTEQALKIGITPNQVTFHITNGEYLGEGSLLPMQVTDPITVSSLTADAPIAAIVVGFLVTIVVVALRRRER